MKPDRQKVVETLFHESLKFRTSEDRQLYLESRQDISDSIKAESASLLT